MKTTSLILIFSGLTSLNNCSSEIKINLPVMMHEKNIKYEEHKNLKNGCLKDSLLVSPVLVSDYYPADPILQKPESKDIL